ncbi:methionyl-tRNA formyltransferase [Desulfobacter hydrogenophilus]|uniref:Methionyl-tRNA formyltransferase n=1 Tax=Desulfobacter hydrogenophilus TaxID=2291 RepID=A0A328FEC8_9BACT|nr:methionyl-tRNA formyltransferase [Desulfobacter hydrogenophilus]NDY72692.1 methionyl-tRNA formyltransferase [Desulfobacter hydrogenophilus]QBH14491.1 methionyl-tRNA formyltransferase [Desulfobacter hydrogenophilus]RAM01453.1 methionyl-tRNA formyltransferase [Desulfobacter hydrogenophilus]
MKNTRIVFMGTPEFSVPALKTLAKEPGFDVLLAVTQPDRPKGRGKKLSPSAVKQAARDLGIDVYQPEKINTPEGIDRLSGLEPDYFVVVAFGQILSRQVLDIPKTYPINIHASLLPKYRGAAPIQAAVLNMDEQTGVSTMVMAEKMDAGDILLMETTPVKTEDTASTLHDRLSQMGADLIIKTIHGIEQKKIIPVPQDHSKASYVSMLKKSDGRINWHSSAKAICAHINAMTPWPGAFTELCGKRLKIFKAVVSSTPMQTSSPPGTVVRSSDKGLFVAAGDDGVVQVLELMGNSGKRLDVAAFLCGNKIDLPACFQ